MCLPPRRKYAASARAIRVHRRTTGIVGERRRRAATVFLVRILFLLLLAGAASAQQGWDGKLRMRIGHDPSWSSPHYDDSSWQLVELHEVPHRNDSVWLRLKVDTRYIRRAPDHPLGVYFAAIAAHEIWWDGERIGGSGRVGRTKQDEIPGLIEAHYQVPDRLAAPGVHTIAVRASAFHRGFSPVHGYWGLSVGDYDWILARRREFAHVAMIALSGFAFTAVFAFAMFWVARRDRSFLLLGTLCLSAAALLIAEAWRPLFGYTYDWHIVRLWCVVISSWLTGVQLVALLVTRFPHRYGRAVLALTAIGATLIPFVPRGWDPKSIYLAMFCVTVSALWAIFAVVRRLHGSVLALIGTSAPVLALIFMPWWWLDAGAYFSLLFLFICLLCSHALEVRQQRHEQARLELEIVRRHMQPHFLMNTLTALSEWIEHEPRTAVRMIDALSEELRILGEMSTRKLVSADDELRLCRSHLETMSLRKDVAYELDVDGVDARQLVPPAVFHTLVENAITHAPAHDARVKLRLNATKDGERTRYVFESPAGNGAAQSGSGTRYIEARLREAWGERWSLTQGRDGAFWRTEIVVPGT
jgi:Histidine kinase